MKRSKARVVFSFFLFFLLLPSSKRKKIFHLLTSLSCYKNFQSATFALRILFTFCETCRQRDRDSKTSCKRQQTINLTYAKQKKTKSQNHGLGLHLASVGASLYQYMDMTRPRLQSPHHFTKFLRLKKKSAISLFPADMYTTAPRRRCRCR